MIPSMKVKVLDNQNIIDLAIAYYGSMEGLPLLLMDNVGFKPDAIIDKGTDVNIRDNVVLEEAIISILNRNGHIVATGSIPQVGKFVITEGGDFWVDENNNYVIYE